MIEMQLSQAASAINAQLSSADRRFRGVSTDSRSIEKDQLFVALNGEQFDGHDFVAAAADNYAAGALVERQCDSPIAQLVCADAQRGLGELAAAWRVGKPVRLIGLTGSNGKTTTKAMLRAILELHHSVLATEGNFNNEIGLPLTLCKLDDSHEFAVIEMGAARPGDIAYLANIARPDIALITNAGAAHLEGMGTVDDVAATKGELIEALADDGIAIINADDDYAGQWANTAGARQRITYGLHTPADVQGSYQPGLLKLATAFGHAEVELPTVGVHNASNALAAAATALALEIALADIKAGLEAFEPVAGRMQRLQTADGWTLIADTYNANPASLRAGIEAALEHAGEHWLVLGDMAELGDESAALHFQAGAEARRLGVVRLYCTGDLSRHAVAAFGEQARFFEQREELIETLRGELTAGVVVMIKGSRSMHMEDVVDALREAA